MSEQVELGAKEFFVSADENGLIEVRMTRDMDFLFRTYIGLGELIRRHLKPEPTLEKFFIDLSGIAVAIEKYAAERAAKAAEEIA